MRLIRENLSLRSISAFGVILLSLNLSGVVHGTPANKAAFSRHYDRFLARNLDRCTTCHLPSANKNPESLDEFPHNPFGARLRIVGRELSQSSKSKDIAARLSL